jgi:ketosteroid isomerase-like protein
MRARSLIPVAALLATVACQAGVAPLTEEDITANRALTEQFIQAANANDWAALTELYTEDCIVMPANEPLVQGRAAYVAWGETFPQLMEFGGAVESIEGYGDLAVIRGTYSMTLDVDGTPVPDTGKYIEIRRKQADGTWQIAIDIFNSDMPLPGEM